MRVHLHRLAAVLSAFFVVVSNALGSVVSDVATK